MDEAMQNNSKDGSQKKLLVIPRPIVDILAAQAKEQRRSVKSLMEKILIDTALEMAKKEVIKNGK